MQELKLNSGIYSTKKAPKWYNSEKFPLVPIFAFRKADYHNTKHYQFTWLFLRFWTLDAFSFAISFVVDTHWGIGFTFILPYLRGVVSVPCPEKLGNFIDKKLSRKPQVLK